MVQIILDPDLSSNHIGHIHFYTLVELKLLDKSWVSVTVVESEHAGKCGCVEEKTGAEIVQNKFSEHVEKQNRYVLQLIAIKNNIAIDEDSESVPLQSKQLPYNAIHVSALDFYNILKQNTDKYRRVRDNELSKLAVSLTLLSELSFDKELYVASKLTVSLISCSLHVHQDTVDEVLKDYFRTPKLLSKDDIFTARVSPHHSNWSQSPRLLSFRVCSMDDCAEFPVNATPCVTRSRFVRFSDTELMLKPACNSFIPRCLCIVKNCQHQQMYDLIASKTFKTVFETYYSQLTDLWKILRLGLVSTSNATVLFEAPRGYGKGLITQAFCLDNCIHYYEKNCYELIGDSMAATEKRIDILFKRVEKCAPCVLYLKNVHVLCKDKEGLNEERRILGYLQTQIQSLGKRNHLTHHGDKPVLIIGSTFATREMSSRFYSMFLYHVKFDTLDEAQRIALLSILFTNGIGIQGDELCNIAKKTSGLIFSDLVALLKMFFSKRGSESDEPLADVFSCIEEIRILKAGSSDAVKVPKVSWQDVGGLEEVKKDIFDTIELPMKFPHLFQGSLQRSGLLLYGPPGCGKTLLAKAIATEFTLNFYSVKGPELLNMYVGQSEENVREVFNKARRMAPCVVFFDELDSLAPSRGRSGDSGGVMDRIVSQLLAELDGMHANTDVFIVAATNRPDLLDSALLRPGRFDKLIYVGVPESWEERLKLLKAVTRKMKLSNGINLHQILEACPDNLTGADFHALASDAAKCCIRRLINHQKEHGVVVDPNNVVVIETDFENAVRHCTPSVSYAELERYKSIRDGIKTKR